MTIEMVNGHLHHRIQGISNPPPLQSDPTLDGMLGPRKLVRILEFDGCKESDFGIFRGTLTMKWTKENTKEDGICYTCGPVRIEPITGDSYYKWFLNGVMGNKKTFHT